MLLLARCPHVSTISHRDDRAFLYRHAPGRSKGDDVACCGGCRCDDRGRRSVWLDQSRGPQYRDPGRRISGHATADPGRRLRRTSAGPAPEKGGCQGEREEPVRDRVPMGARVRDGRGPDVQGRRHPLRRQRVVHGVGRRLEAILQGRFRPRRPFRFRWAERGPSPERRARPDEGPRGPGLRPLSRCGRARALHGARRGDTDRPRPLRQGVPRPVHARRAGGSSVPEQSLPHRQGPALEAARAPRHRLPGRRLAEIQGPVPAAVGTDARRGQARDRVRPSGPARRRRPIPEGDRLVPRRG